MTEYCTIDGFENLTAQEMFDISARHLLKQNKRSLRSLKNCSCAYRGVDGLKCAAGVFLKDEFPKECEGTAWRSLVERGCAPDTNSELIQSLQRIHDGHPPKEWRRMLANLAAKWGLRMVEQETGQ